MTELGKALAALPTAAAVTPKKNSHPAGWEPGVAWDGEKGSITTEPLEAVPSNWTEILALWGLDPEAHEIVGNVGFRAWDTAQGRRHSYRANVKLKAKSSLSSGVDLDDLTKAIMKHKPAKTSFTGNNAFVVCIADTQIGKADGDGTEGIINRFLAAIDAVENRINELRKCGRSLGSLYVLGLGDIIENCSGHYASQEFTSELNLTEQLRVTRTLIVKALTRWSLLFDEVIVAAVPGNHGEVRKDGKAYTNPSDNFDTDVFACAAEVLSANPDTYSHVSFAFPKGNDLTMTLDIAGTVVGLAHGHQFSSQAKVTDWWKGQALGRQPVGDADLLITGHFHNLRVVQDARTWIQCPSLDGGSEWWTSRSGENSPAGMLTLVIGNGGWSDLAIV